MLPKKPNAFLLLLTFLACTTMLSHSQTVRLAEGQYNFDIYTIEDGIPESKITALCQDHNGFLWIGTHGGLSRFDGKSFKNFTEKDGLVNNLINSIAVDKNNHLWIATRNGVSRYDGVSFRNYSTVNGLPHNYTRKVLSDKNGNVWLATADGIVRIVVNEVQGADNKQFFYYPIKGFSGNPHVRDIYEDRQGSIYCSMLETTEVLKFYGDSFKTIYKQKGNTMCLAVDRSGHIWIGQWGDPFLIRYNPADSSVIKYNKDDIGSPVMNIMEDRKGRLWFGTWDAGAFLFDGNSFRNFTNRNGLPINSIWSFLEDREGNIWIGTFGAGLCRFSGERFVRYTIDDGLVNNTVYCVEQDHEGNIWFGTDNGISRLGPGSNGRFENTTSVKGVPVSKVIDIITSRNDDVWFGIYNSDVRAIKYKNGKFSIEPQVASTAVFSILEDSKGKMWFGTDGGGTIMFNGEEKKTFYMEGGKGQNRVVYIMEDSKGNVWFATYIMGVNIFDGNEMKNFPEKEVNTNKLIEYLIEDMQGHIWMATDGDGLLRCRYSSETGIQLTDKITVADGLSSNHISSLSFDEHDNLWIATNKGVNRLNGNPYFKSGIKEIRQYGKSEGFMSMECSNGILNDKQGKIWFATSNGAIVYNPEKDTINTLEPQTCLTSILLFNKDTLTHYPDGLSLPYNKNHLTFGFAGISMTAPEKVRYRWKLEKFDSDWHPITGKNEVTYSNLPAGNYVFKVKACNNDGIWNERPAAFRFTITPPFWQTWWFYAICFLTVAGVVSAFIKIRERNLRREKRILEEKVKQRTVLITKQKEELAEKNKDITDSIRYASNIQLAILQPVEEIKKTLPESFILFKPKDIVSGDFYFFAEVNQYTILAACDSTGHGVPGAFMSILGSRLLNEIVNDKLITDAAVVLNRLKDGIINAFGKAGATGKQKDGMDMALCVLNLKTNKLQYAGANNPLYIVRNNNKLRQGSKPLSELTVVKPDKQPVGYFTGEQKSFTNHNIQLQKDDTFYIFSDGYQDQFGGLRGKKFMSKQFRQLISDFSEMSMEEQRKHLDKTIEDWKGGRVQVDDILVIGVRI